MLLLALTLGVAAAEDNLDCWPLLFCNDLTTVTPQAWLDGYGAGTSGFWLYTIGLLNVNACKLSIR